MRSISVLAVLTAIALPVLSAPAAAFPRDLNAIISGGLSYSEDSTPTPTASDTSSDVAEDSATPTGFGIIASSVLPTASYDEGAFSSLLEVLSSLFPTATEGSDASDPSSTAASSDCSSGVTVEVGSDSHSDDSDESDKDDSSDEDTPDEPGPGFAANIPSMEGEPHNFINRRTALLTASCGESSATSSATSSSVVPAETSESLTTCLSKCSRKRAMDETHDCVDNCYSVI
ncbi:hypothetical protein FB107DRAFT_272767 [Schizophyllum commune]